MKKGQTSTRGGYQDFLCPFTDMYITQGSMQRSGTHAGLYANDVRGSQSGVRYPYYAPCDLVCVKTYPSSGQVMWQSVNKVRFANGRTDYATIMTAHDDTMDSYVGQKIKQGAQMGNMGNKGNSTGVHCHIEISQSKTTTWTKNKYGNYMFPNEYDLDSCYFVDGTNILNGSGGSWKKLADVKVNVADQVIKVGSKVRFNGVFKIDEVIKPNATYKNGAIGCYATCYGAPCNKNDYIPCGPLATCNANGSNVNYNGTLKKGGYWTCNTTFTVKAVELPTKTTPRGVATLEADGVKFRVDCGPLYEVSNS